MIQSVGKGLLLSREVVAELHREYYGIRIVRGPIQKIHQGTRRFPRPCRCHTDHFAGPLWTVFAGIVEKPLHFQAPLGANRAVNRAYIP
jgi:hypothetical protein